MLDLKLTAIVAVVLGSLLTIQTHRISSLKLQAQENMTAAVKAERDRALKLNQEKDELAEENRAMVAQIESLEAKANEDKKALDVAVAAADAERVRHKSDAARITSSLQERARNARTDGEREASAAAIGVLADVYARADERAGVLAAEADRSRLAGSTCEAQYDAVRQRHQAWLSSGSEALSSAKASSLAVTVP